QHIGDRGLARRGKVRLERDAGRGRHVGYRLDELFEIALDGRVQLDNLDPRLETVLVIDRACDADRLMGRAEVRVTTDLGGNIAAQTTDARDVFALGRFGQLPPDMSLVLAFRRYAAAFHHHGGGSKMTFEMGAPGGNVASVDIDHHRLHWQDISGRGLSLGGNRAGDDIDGGPLVTGPVGKGRHLVGNRMIGVDPDVVWAAIEPLTLVDEAAHRDQAFAVAKD